MADMCVGCGSLVALTIYVRATSAPAARTLRAPATMWGGRRRDRWGDGREGRRGRGADKRRQHGSDKRRGRSFGATSSVFSFHRVGEAIVGIARCLAAVAAARYVDDFFGSDRAGLPDHVCAGAMIDAICKAIGFFTDPK